MVDDGQRTKAVVIVRVIGSGRGSGRKRWVVWWQSESAAAQNPLPLFFGN